MSLLRKNLPSLENLPFEILFIIFRMVEPEELVALWKTSKTMKQNVEKYVDWLSRSGQLVDDSGTVVPEGNGEATLQKWVTGRCHLKSMLLPLKRFDLACMDASSAESFLSTCAQVAMLNMNSEESQQFTRYIKALLKTGRLIDKQTKEPLKPKTSVAVATSSLIEGQVTWLAPLDPILPETAKNTNKLLNILFYIQAVLLDSQQVPAMGLRQLIGEIRGMVESGKSSSSGLLGYLRELLLGYYYVSQGNNAVQYGVRGADPDVPTQQGAGGDITLFTPDGQQALLTIQSKYIGGKQEKLLVENLRLAVVQLSGVAGEVPYLHSKRVADIVIEEAEVCPALHQDTQPNRAYVINLIKRALAPGKEKGYFARWWLYVDEIILTIKQGNATCTIWKIEVSHAQPFQRAKDLTLDQVPECFTIRSIQASQPLQFKDFPYMCPFAVQGYTISLGGGYNEELGEIRAYYDQLMLNKAARSGSQPVVKNKADDVPVSLTDEQYTTLLQLIAKPEVTPKEDIAFTLDFLDFDALSGETSQSPDASQSPDSNQQTSQTSETTSVSKVSYETISVENCIGLLMGIALTETEEQRQGLLRFIEVLSGAEGKTYALEARELLPSIFGQIAKQHQSLKEANSTQVPARINIADRASALFIHINSAKKVKIVVDPDEELKQLVAQNQAYKSSIEGTCTILQEQCYMSKLTACQALREMLNFPSGLLICQYIASGMFEKVGARNYLTVLGQLKNPGERASSLEPLGLACSLLQQPKPYDDCVLVFEYDERTPGMWQICGKKHFDLDVGWAKESSPLEVLVFYQVKMIAKAESIIGAARSSFSGDQLSLQVPGEKALVIYCKEDISHVPPSWVADAAIKFGLLADVSQTTIRLSFSNQAPISIPGVCLRILGRACLTLQDIQNGKALTLASSSGQKVVSLTTAGSACVKDLLMEIAAIDLAGSITTHLRKLCQSIEKARALLSSKEDADLQQVLEALLSDLNQTLLSVEK